jgi:hypothetical protein
VILEAISDQTDIKFLKPPMQLRFDMRERPVRRRTEDRVPTAVLDDAGNRILPKTPRGRVRGGHHGVSAFDAARKLVVGDLVPIL